MSDFTPTGRLATWEGTQPDLRDWSDDEMIDGLRQLGVEITRASFTADAMASDAQSDLESAWISTSGTRDEGLQVFLWLGVQELWERWKIDSWPKDRMARMFAYLVDAEYAHEWAARCHAPLGIDVMNSLIGYLNATDDPKATLDELVELLGMPAVAWPSKLLDAMAEWLEVGNMTLAEAGGRLMADVLGEGHGQVFLATACMTARLYDRAQAAALQVPHDAPVKAGFAEMTGYLCLAAASAPSAKHWLMDAKGRSRPKRSELTFAAETARDFIKDAQAMADEVPDRVRKAALQAASQSCFYAVMAFAGM